VRLVRPYSLRLQEQPASKEGGGVMLEQVLQYLHNWFLVPDGVHEDTYTIEGGGITLPFLQNGQYFRIMGSVFNDGLYRYDDTLTLTDETFDGVIWALAIPKAIVDTAADMETWEAKNGAAASGPYQSESKADYSYSKAINSKGGVFTVWDAFENRLSAYRKPRELGYVRPSRAASATYYCPYNTNYPWR